MGNLATGVGPESRDAVGVTLETDFVGERRVVDLATAEAHAADHKVWAFDELSESASHGADQPGLSCMGIVAVNALYVAAHGEGSFGRVVNTDPHRAVVAAALANVGGDVQIGDLAAVAIQAAVLFTLEAEKPFGLRGSVNFVAVGAGVVARSTTRRVGRLEF